jgi:uncharacterized protein
VGININEYQSKHLLSYVSGIGEKLAENIVNYRSENGPFENRKQLKSASLGRKAYQQGAAFIRISNARKPWITRLHPEAYAIVEKWPKT